MADGFSILDPFSSVDLDIDGRTDGIKQWAMSNRQVIDPLKRVLDGMISGVDSALHALPPVVMLVLIALIAWQARRQEPGLCRGLDSGRGPQRLP